MKVRISIALIITSLGLISCSRLKKLLPKKQCLEQRSALKIELKSVFFIRATVNSCKNKIIEVHSTKEHSTNFEPTLNDNYSSAHFKIDKNLESFLISILANSQRNKAPLKLAASSLFRKSKFTKLLPKAFEKVLKRKVSIFSKNQEAREYYLAYLASLSEEEEAQGIWYIDNQKNIIILKDGGSKEILYSRFTPDSLRKKIISWEGGGSSPYPIGAFNGKRAIEYSSAAALKELGNRDISELLRNQRLIGLSPGHHLVGHYLPSKQGPFSRYQLEEILKKRISRNSHREYEENTVTSLFLILGHMRALNIQTIQPLIVNTKLGVLFHSSLW